MYIYGEFYTKNYGFFVCLFFCTITSKYMSLDVETYDKENGRLTRK